MKVETQEDIKVESMRLKPKRTMNLRTAHLTTPSQAATSRATTRDISWRDRLGISLSILCLVHCLLTPVMIALLPVGVSLGFWQHGFHHVFLILVPLVALLAFVPGWRRHGDPRVWYWGLLGVALLIAGVSVAEAFESTAFDWRPLAAETLFTILGGACLIRAHLLNRQLCACCDEGHDHLRGHDHDHGHACEATHGHDHSR